MDNSGGFRYKILGHVGLLEENLVFFVSLGIAEILGFPGFSICAEVVLLEGLSTALWLVPLLRVLEGLWGFVVLTELLKQTLILRLLNEINL